MATWMRSGPSGSLLLGLWVAMIGCTPQPPITCVELAGPADCVAVAKAAVDSLSADERTRVLRTAVRHSTVATCLSAPGCQPIADVDFDVAGATRRLTVTVSRLPDGRLVAETY